MPRKELTALQSCILTWFQSTRFSLINHILCSRIEQSQAHQLTAIFRSRKQGPNISHLTPGLSMCLHSQPQSTVLVKSGSSGKHERACALGWWPTQSFTVYTNLRKWVEEGREKEDKREEDKTWQHLASVKDDSNSSSRDLNLSLNTSCQERLCFYFFLKKKQHQHANFGGNLVLMFLIHLYLTHHKVVVK